jgi:hypothetical protein
VKFATKAAAALLAVAMATATATASAAPITAQDECDQIQYRYERGVEVVLWACPSPRPGVDWYHASISSATGLKHGDSIQVAYYPYYDKGYVPGSKRTAGLSTYAVSTPSYYGLPGELQACADLWFGPVCGWY